jgi:hypothetical protein
MLYPGLLLADINPDSYKIEEVRYCWFIGVLLILLHKVGSFLHVLVPLAEVISAVVEAANKSFLDVSNFFFSSWDGHSHLYHMFYDKGRCFPSKKRDKALRMMFGSGGMVMVGKGN